LILSLGLAALAVSLDPLAAAAQPGMGETSEARKCKVDEELDVMALVYNDREPDASFAMVAVGKGPGRMVGVGSFIAGKPIIAVLPRALWLGPAEDPCWLPLSHEGKQRVKNRKKHRKRKKRRRKRRRKKRR
jgi:hypothetical protein